MIFYNITKFLYYCYIFIILLYEIIAIDKISSGKILKNCNLIHWHFGTTIHCREVWTLQSQKQWTNSTFYLHTSIAFESISRSLNINNPGKLRKDENDRPK